MVIPVLKNKRASTGLVVPEVSRSKAQCSRVCARTYTANEGSTDGSAHARKFEGGQWVDVGKPMLYLFNRGVGVEMNGGGRVGVTEGR